MDLKLVFLLISYLVESFFCAPLSVKTLTNSDCHYPPLYAVDEDKLVYWQHCDPSVFEKKTAPYNKTMISTICQRIQDLEENSCALLKNVSFPFNDMFENLIDDPGTASVEKLCSSNNLKDFAGCIPTCEEAFTVCDLYVATENLLRKKFSEAARADFKSIDNFIHSGSLAHVFPFPHRGSLHERKELENCTVLNASSETKALCTAVVEVAVNISETGTCIKLDGIHMMQNISQSWEPCEGLPGLLENVTCDSLQPLKSKDTCNNTCNKGGQNICKMIYLGLESLKLSAEKQTKQVSAETVNPAAASKSVNDNPESGGGNLDGGDTSVGEVLDDNDTGHPENEPSGTENKASQKGGDLHGDKDIQPDTHKDAGKDGHQNIDSGKKASVGINKEAGKEEEENVGKGNQPSGDTGKEAGKEEDQNVGKVNQPSGDSGKEAGKEEDQNVGKVNQPSGDTGKEAGKEEDQNVGKVNQPSGDTGKAAGKEEDQNVGKVNQPSGDTGKEAGKEEDQNVGKVNQPSGDTGKEAGKEDQNGDRGNQPSGDTGTGGSTAKTSAVTSHGAIVSSTLDYDETYIEDDFDDDDDDSGDEDEYPGDKDQNAAVDTGDGKENSAKNTEHGAESHKPPVITESEEEEPSGGHFMAYFIVCAVLLVAGYIVFHNKQKIIALVVEGKNAHSSRRPSTKDYKKLKTEDVIPSLEKSAYTKNYVF